MRLLRPTLALLVGTALLGSAPATTSTASAPVALCAPAIFSPSLVPFAECADLYRAKTTATAVSVRSARPLNLNFAALAPRVSLADAILAVQGTSLYEGDSSTPAQRQIVVGTIYRPRMDSRASSDGLITLSSNF